VVIEFVADGVDLSGFERNLRLSDAVVRHKVIRLPDSEATRRGVLGTAPDPVPAEAS